MDEQEFDVSSIPPVEHDNSSIPFDDDKTGQKSPNSSHITHAPLDLGGGSFIEKKKPETNKPKLQYTTSTLGKQDTGQNKFASTERITGVRTFFTKLHAGALTFLDGQITDWLKDNPGIVIRRTNITVGEVAAKKTEPNLIITVWY